MDQGKMPSLKRLSPKTTENDLSPHGSAEMGDIFTVLWLCSIVCVHTGFIQAAHINCVL